MPYFNSDELLTRISSDLPYKASLKRLLMQAPAAEVVAKKDYDKLDYTLMGVMHSVDKWLDGSELDQDEVNRAATMREKTLQIIEEAQTRIKQLEKERDCAVQHVSRLENLLCEAKQENAKLLAERT